MRIKLLLLTFALLLAGCAGFMETFAPETADRQRQERQDKAYAKYFADITPRPEIKKLLLSDDIAHVRAGIALFSRTPEGQEMYMRSVKATYGPLCAGVGLKEDTPEFAQCVIYRAEADANRAQQAQEAERIRRMMDSITCRETVPGTVKCSSW